MFDLVALNYLISGAKSVRRVLAFLFTVQLYSETCKLWFVFVQCSIWSVAQGEGSRDQL